MRPGLFGWNIFRSPGREMGEECVNCPFKMRREGQPYLTPDRYEGIEFAVSMGQPFHCHKTVYAKGVEHPEDPDTGALQVKSYDRSYKLCIGAIRAVQALQKAEEEAPE